MWSYDDTLVEAKDVVRFMVGDTDTTDQMAQDDEITRFLALYVPVVDKPPYLAAAAVCDAIAGRFARQIQQSVGSLSASFQQQYDHYKDLAAQFRVMFQTDGIGIPAVDYKVGMVGGKLAVASPVLGGGGRTYLGSDD